MRFEFTTATRIVFGAGTFSEVGKLVQPWGQRALIVTGRDPKRATRLLEQLARERISTEIFQVNGEPSLAVIQEGLQTAQRHRAEMIVGFGGGSVIDAAKAIAGLMTNEGDPLDFLEVVGQGKPLLRPALPWIAIPTTAGTGAEVTRNAVISIPERGVKVSLRSPFLLARVALIDPELTFPLPPLLTASTGMDALTQLVEAYVCLKSNPISDGLCAVALPKLARALPEAWRSPHSLTARIDVSFASLSSGLALANAGLGAVHGFAAAIGGMFNAPHGVICATLLAPVMAANLRALQARAPGSASLPRYEEIARWLTGNPTARAAEGIVWIQQRVIEFQLPRLRQYGIEATDVSEIVARAQNASSTKGNPVSLTGDELTSALLEAI